MRIWSLIIILFIAGNLLAQDGKWGWNAHRYINDKAVDFLPPDMSYFISQRSYLSAHAIDPDTDDNPGYYHYIDIDVYPEFFSGSLPHQWQDMIDTYGYNQVINNGIVPWIIEQWSDSLTSLLVQRKWTDAWQVAAELGHYVADSHQPLHLTENYNGWLTGNGGIHSRYETQMISPYLEDLPLPTGGVQFWSSPIDSVFDYIDHLYPYVDDIMAADDAASTQDPNYGSVYYSILWQLLQPQTTDAIHLAILDLASIWYTCWINAGSPTPTMIGEQRQIVPGKFKFTAYPNPFNPEITIELTPGNSFPLDVAVFDIHGRMIRKLLERKSTQSGIKLKWDGRDKNGIDMASGMYFIIVRQQKLRLTKKVLFLK